MQGKTFISVQEVAEELGVSKSYAYKVVKQLNEELKQQGLSYSSRPGKCPVFP